MEAFGKHIEDLCGNLAIVNAAGDAGKAQQRECGNGLAGGFGSIVVVLNPEDQIFSIGGSLIKSTVHGIMELCDHGIGNFDGELQVLRL